MFPSYVAGILEKLLYKKGSNKGILLFCFIRIEQRCPPISAISLTFSFLDVKFNVTLHFMLANIFRCGMYGH